MSIRLSNDYDDSQDEKFREGLRERAEYWDRCTWWRQ